MSSDLYDQASRYTAKLDPPDFLGWLLRTDRVVFDHWLDARTVPFPKEPDRTCDTVAGLADPTGVPWALTVEFQTEDSGDEFGRFLEYLARLWQELRVPGTPGDRYQVALAVIHLTGKGRASRRMTLGLAGVETTLMAAERHLAEEDAAATLADVRAGTRGRWILSWVPLMRGGSEEGIIVQWKELAGMEPDQRRRADYGGLALVFSERAGCAPVWKKGLEGWNVIISPQVQEWQAQARAEGEARGRAEGEARGRAEGEARGRAEGEARGRAEGLHNAVLRVIRRRFGEAAAKEAEPLIRAVQDVALLEAWLDRAIDSSSWAEFRKLLQG